MPSATFSQAMKINESSTPHEAMIEKIAGECRTSSACRQDDVETQFPTTG